MPRTKDGKPVLNKPFKSKQAGKKYSVYVKSDTGKATKEQRKSFRARMMGIKRKDGSYAYKDKTSPAYWALNYLW